MSDSRIAYSIGLPCERGEVLEFLLDYFLPEEPCSVAVGLTKDVARGIYAEFINMDDGVTVLAMDSEGKLVGVRTSKLVRLAEVRKGPVEGPTSHAEPSGRDFLRLVHALEQGLEHIVPLCHTELVLKFLAVCVAPSHYRRGIAEEAMKRSVAAAKAKGASQVLAIASSIKSQRLFQKLSFTPLKIVNHAEFLGEDGQRIYNCKAPHLPALWKGDDCTAVLHKAI